MLKITKKVEYALIAVRHLQENKDKLVPVAEISSSYGIPREVLAKTLQKHLSTETSVLYGKVIGAVKEPSKRNRGLLKAVQMVLKWIYTLLGE